MASPSAGPRSVNAPGKKRPAKYLSHGSKRKRGLDLRSGLQGFLITCDGGRERQSCREAIGLLEKFHEKVTKDRQNYTNGVANDNGSKQRVPPSSESGILDIGKKSSLDSGHENRSSNSDESGSESRDEEDNAQKAALAQLPSNEEGNSGRSVRVDEAGTATKGDSIECLLEAEMTELRDKNKARFAGLETGCNGIVFVRMLKEDARDPAEKTGPNEVVEAIMHEAVTFRKPLTRFCLRFLPVEITCYASADEVRKAAEPFILHHFPVGQGEQALKFAVVYEARANTSLDRMEIINAVAKLVLKPHSVDLKKPDKTITVQVMKTICAIGVVTNYKEFAKYNLRQLTSPKQ